MLIITPFTTISSLLVSAAVWKATGHDSSLTFVVGFGLFAICTCIDTAGERVEKAIKALALTKSS